MKKSIILILFLMMYCYAIIAQPTFTNSTDVSGTFPGNMQSIVANLDKSDITTHILSDLSFPFVDLSKYDGTSEENILTKRSWKEIYRQLFNASIDENVLPTPESFYANTSPYVSQDIVPIVIANVKYHRFKENALDDNLVSFDGNVYNDVPERSESPYEQKRLFASTVMKDELYSGIVHFKLSTSFFLTNTQEDISSIEIDFDDGNGYITIDDLNSQFDVTYSTEGTKNLLVRATIDGETFVSHSQFALKSVANDNPDYTFDVTGTQSYSGETGTAKAYVLYGCGNNGQLRKPIIVSDGFDDGNLRNFAGMMALFNRHNFVGKLIADGYDVILLDYNDGAGYIQKNAYVLVSLLNTVNSQLAANGSKHKIVYAGPSMGGIIGRYALSYMEQNSIAHNVKLYISFDAPHLGANIPLGDQFWLDFFAGYAQSQGAMDGLATVNSPAAKQLLVYHYSTFPYTNSLRTTMVNDANYTMPAQCRKIAIANGSGNGTTYFNECTQMIGWSWTKSPYNNIIRGNTWSIPTGSPCRIFQGHFPIQFLFGAPTGFVTQDTYAGGQGYDTSPGGSIDVNKTIADGDTDNHGDIQSNFDNTCFIPMTSALSLSGVGLTFNAIGSVAGYPHVNNTAITPFASIYAPVSNQEHVMLTTENIGWLLDELGSEDLYIQNITVSGNNDFEARNTVKVGTSVTTMIPSGNVVFNSSSSVDVRAGVEIDVKEETTMQLGTESHLFIEDECADSPLNRMVGNPFNETSASANGTNNSNAPSGKLASTTTYFFNSYPNPSNEVTTFECTYPFKNNLEVFVYNTCGQLVGAFENRTGNDNGNTKFKLETSKLPDGIYFCVAKTDGSQVGNIKLVVSK
jgi:hypothetical protein